MPLPRRWSVEDSYDFIASFLLVPAKSVSSAVQRHTFHASTYHTAQRRTGRIETRIHTRIPTRAQTPVQPLTQTYIQRYAPARDFHDYFVTHLPSSSLHPDSRSSAGPHHKLPRAASTPHTTPSGESGSGRGRANTLAAAAPPMIGASRELTVVRIPIRSAKHHFGVSVSRGTRPYNEDTYQAGTIEIPAFAKRAPVSLSRRSDGPAVAGKELPSGTSADGASGDPQVFYFGVFDGHGGNECSEFLREELQDYIEKAAVDMGLGSSLKKSHNARDVLDEAATQPAPVELERELVSEWKETVGGYFRRFRPEYFDLSKKSSKESSSLTPKPVTVEAVLMYAFLKADLDFVTSQARKPDSEDENRSDSPLNAHDILGSPAHLNLPSSPHRIGGPTRFVGGSTASIALISTPTPTPFWHPSSPSSLIVAHVGDTRIILCETATGLATPLTTDHHPSTPLESTRLRRYAASFATDSFGEERMSGLANTRAFGDLHSKRIGVSAEPQITTAQLAPAEHAFLVLVSDGVSGHGALTDQEIVDIIKEARTPEQGARDVIAFATEVSKDGDNATCLVVRLGGWERRGEGGLGSLGTKENRDWRRAEAADPRRGRT